MELTIKKYNRQPKLNLQISMGNYKNKCEVEDLFQEFMMLLWRKT